MRKTPCALCATNFHIPDGVIYLDGNSLGVLPKTAAARVAEVVTQEWGHGLIRSWNSAGWFELPQRLGDKIARLIGAAPGEVVGDRQHLDQPVQGAERRTQHRRAGCAAAQSDRERTQQLPDRPLHCRRRCARERGLRLQLVEPEEIAAALTPEVAVLMLTHVNYRTGAMHDMAAVTAAAHAAGALTVWDLAHSAGAVPVDLNARQGRLRHRLRLQIPQRRTGRAGLRLGQPAACRPLLAAAGGLVGPCRAVRVHARLPARAGHRALPVRHPADAEPGGAGVRARHRAGGRAAGRHGGPARQVAGA